LVEEVTENRRSCLMLLKLVKTSRVYAAEGVDGSAFLNGEKVSETEWRASIARFGGG